MIKFIVDEKVAAKGVHLMHNANLGCEDMPKLDDQVLIGYFSNFELAYKRVRMNWPNEKVEVCSKCCSA